LTFGHTCSFSAKVEAIRPSMRRRGDGRNYPVTSRMRQKRSVGWCDVEVLPARSAALLVGPAPRSVHEGGVAGRRAWPRRSLRPRRRGIDRAARRLNRARSEGPSLGCSWTPTPGQHQLLYFERRSAPHGAILHTVRHKARGSLVTHLKVSQGFYLEVCFLTRGPALIKVFAKIGQYHRCILE